MSFPVKAIGSQNARSFIRCDAVIQAADIGAEKRRLAFEPVMSEKVRAFRFAVKVASLDFGGKRLRRNLYARLERKILQCFSLGIHPPFDAGAGAKHFFAVAVSRSVFQFHFWTLDRVHYGTANLFVGEDAEKIFPIADDF